MVDRTTYSSADKTPELAVRQIFARQRVPETICKLFGESSLLTVDGIAVLGDDLASVKAAVTAIVGEANLGDTDAKKTTALLSFAAVWKACSALQDHYALRRARMEEDPHKIPELGGDQRSEFRARFVTNHADVILNVWREPHKRFVERLNRD